MALSLVYRDGVSQMNPELTEMKILPNWVSQPGNPLLCLLCAGVTGIYVGAKDLSTDAHIC